MPFEKGSQSHLDFLVRKKMPILPRYLHTIIMHCTFTARESLWEELVINMYIHMMGNGRQASFDTESQGGTSGLKRLSWKCCNQTFSSLWGSKTGVFEAKGWWDGKWCSIEYFCVSLCTCLCSFLFFLPFCTDGLTRSPPLYVSLNVGAYMTGWYLPN